MRRLLALVWLLAGCGASGTGVVFELMGSGSIDRVDVVGSWSGGGIHRTGQSTPRGAIALPTELLVELPDSNVSAHFEVTAALGQAPRGAASADVMVEAHHIARVPLVLGASADAGPDQLGDADGGPDLATPSATPDLAALDGAADLSQPRDLGVACSGARCPYQYRRRVTVHNASSGTLAAGYSIRVPLPALTGKTRADLNDLRVFEDAPNQERDRLVDSAPPGQSAALWFALGADLAAGGTDSGYWLYYGDPAAGAPPAAGANVFAFFDDFPGTTLDARWTASGSPAVSGGVLTLHQNGSDGVRSDYQNDKVPVTAVFEARARVTDPASAGQVTPQGTFWFWLGWQHQNDFTPSDPWILWIQRGANTVQAELKTTSCPSACAQTSGGPLDNAYHWYRIERGAAATNFFLDGALAYTANDNDNGDYSIMIRDWAVTSDLAVDWVRARPLASPEPTVTVGAEEVLH